MKRKGLEVYEASMVVEDLLVLGGFRSCQWFQRIYSIGSYFYHGVEVYT